MAFEAWIFKPDYYFSKALNSNKKEVDWYRILLVFPGLGNGFFSMDLDFWLMFVEHQSTSGAKISGNKPCTRAVLLNFLAIVFTIWIVVLREKAFENYFKLYWTWFLKCVIEKFLRISENSKIVLDTFWFMRNV